MPAMGDKADTVAISGGFLYCPNGFAVINAVQLQVGDDSITFEDSG